MKPVLLVKPVLLAQGLVIDMMTGTAVVVGFVAAVGYLYREIIKAKDREAELLLQDKNRALADLESTKKSYEEIADEALRSAKATADFYRQQAGLPPIPILAAVIPESHSPSTREQREAAKIQTMRAAMARIKLETGQEARPEPDHAAEPAVKPPEPAPLGTPPTPAELLSLATELRAAKESEPKKFIVENMEVKKLIVPEKPEDAPEKPEGQQP